MIERSLISVGDEPANSNGRAAFLTALRDDAKAITPEPEGVLVDILRGEAVFTLSDGETLTFDVAELRSALRAA